MKKNIIKLTDSEKQVLDLLWNIKQPLTSAEIVRLCKNRTWKASYIHIMISSLLRKEMIEVAGFKKTTKNYARTFGPTMTRDEWHVLQVTQDEHTTSRTLATLFFSLLEKETDPDIINELTDHLYRRRKELNMD